MPAILDTLGALGLLDYGYLSLLLLSMLFGALRGFIHVSMSLVSWFVALAAAHFLADFLAPYLVATGLTQTPRYALSYVSLFVMALMLWNMLGLLLKQSASGLGLGGLDRFLGGLIGLARGALMAMALTLLVGITPAEHTPTWQNSQAVQLSKASARALKPYLPAALSALIP